MITAEPGSGPGQGPPRGRGMLYSRGRQSRPVTDSDLQPHCCNPSARPGRQQQVPMGGAVCQEHFMMGAEIQIARDFHITTCE